MKFLLLVIVFTITIFSLANAQSGYKLYTKIPLKGNRNWDYLKVDEPGNRLFVTHSDRAHIINLKTNQQIGEIKNLYGARL